MDSNLHQTHSFINQQQQKPIGSGLMRYQSAPSSYFSTFLDKQLYDDFLIRPTTPEQIFPRFLANSGTFPGQNLVHMKQGSPVREAEQVQNKTGYLQKQGNYNFPVSSQGFYQNQLLLPQPRPPQPFSDQNLGSQMECGVVTSMGMEGLPQMKVGIGASGSESGNSNSNLVRHSSSPAGFFSNINIGMESGYPVLRGMGDYGTDNRDASYSVASRPPHPCSGRMSPIAEIGSKNMRENSPENVGFREPHGGNYVTGFSIGSWDDSSSTPAGGKGFADDDLTFSGLTEVENQGGEAANSPRMLARHLSLQNTSAEMDALEKILQLQDSVPCKIRAKRGCATHPRSIAERVRRTRISERMRKLQDVVPNMDKQTNTAGMLDLAVDYIKDLQRQIKILSENRAQCICTKM